MAIETQVPIIPHIVWGAQRIWTKDHPKKLLRPKVPISVAVGEPIAREHAAAAEADARARQASLDVAQRLKAAGVPVRDIGAVTGLSFQRAQLLANT
jgi:1-acyl-sn-glycerol-3-phosphate acyltransferase